MEPSMWPRRLHRPLIALALVTGGCGRDAGPASITPTAPSSPYVFAEITGSVVDTAFRPVAGVTVEILDGAEAGRSAVSDAVGTFVFSSGTYGSNIAYRATKDGYVTQTVTGPLAYSWPSSKASLVITLESTVAPVEIESGEYVAIMVTDPSCTQIPDQMRTRTYSARVTKYSETHYFLRMRGLLNGLDQLGIAIAGHDLRFENDEGLYEQVAPGTSLRFFGVGTATVDGPTVPLPLEFNVVGLVDYCTSGRATGNLYECDSPTYVRCSSNRHRLALERP
jgi:hypothetical protein